MAKEKIDEKIKNINTSLNECIIDGEITSEQDGLYLTLTKIGE